MNQNLIDICDLIEHAIDNAFDGQMNLKLYDFLKSSKVKKNEIDLFISSSTTNELGSLILDLDEYIKGGSDNDHKQLREGYGHIPKMTEDREDAKSILNNQDTHINRGFELLLRNRRRKPEPPKTFQIKFGNMVSLFRREIVFHLNFYLDIRKK